MSMTVNNHSGLQPFYPQQDLTTMSNFSDSLPKLTESQPLPNNVISERDCFESYIANYIAQRVQTLVNEPSENIELKVIQILEEVKELLNERRRYNRRSQTEEMNLQESLQDKTYSLYQSSSFWAKMTGIVSGSVGILAGLSPALSPMIIGKINNVALENLTDAHKNIADTISRTTQAISTGADTAGRVIQTTKEGERYRPQSQEGNCRTRYQDMTSEKESEGQAIESLKNFLLQWIQQIKDKNQTTGSF